jgi:hypothetical protein
MPAVLVKDVQGRGKSKDRLDELDRQRTMDVCDDAR